MTEDGLFPMPYGKLLDRLSGVNVYEVKAEPAKDVESLGCRVLGRDLMCCGTPFALVRADGPDTVIQTPEIRHILEVFGIGAECFRNL